MPHQADEENCESAQNEHGGEHIAAHIKAALRLALAEISTTTG